MASVLRERGADVRVAPVGGGFRILHDDLTAAGIDPLADGTDFVALYQADGSHPSLQGSYLAACILAGTITGSEPERFAADPRLGQDESARLRGVCGRALEDPKWDMP